ncbi:hypothetical protein K505DRAFT_413237 [Melanomma pulvis-pyrius CBS 109.77]|uniref:Exonuclease domain-containing protein n=1 Tax=Melanomma pulvis-pyrius CBS 109.77 TaxID=1314802 RepID=A0A6A6XUB6_9PLEO|nr:hypothetical protein K505DRAFT_413237 [Melanomma pulvis-pyrius CBS 109.77]
MQTKMAKRKRGLHEEVRDYSVGETLARLKDEAAETNPTPTPAADDDGSEWTTIGAPKKKRRSQDLEDRPERSPAHDSNRLRRHSDTHSLESQFEQKEKVSDKPKDTPTDGSPPSMNPFVAQGNDPSARPANPFAKKKKDGEVDERIHRVADASPSAQHEPTKEQPEREERRKERKVARNYPAIEHSHHARQQSKLKITDLQSLVLYLLADGNAPQWVSVRHRMNIRQVVVLMVPGLELGMFNGDVSLESSSSKPAQNEDAGKTADDVPDHTRPKRLHISPDDYYPASLKPHQLPTSLKPLADIFPHVWPMSGSGEHRNNQYHRVHSPIHTMLTSQIPKTKEEKQMKNSNHKGPLPQNTRDWENKRTPVTEYIASVTEQRENEYVLHPAWFATPEAKEAAYQSRRLAKQSADDGWVDTNIACLEEGDVPDAEIEQGSITVGRRILTVDCEMCKSVDDEHVLTRVSLIDWDGSVVLDRLVKPEAGIKDYLTQWSGITEAMLQDVTTTLADIQKELLELLTGRTILVGHSLNSDLNALKLTHPFFIDTAIIYPHARGPPYKQSLKWLAQKYLSSEIQKGAKGHNSVEDARACLDLLKQKCERGPRWGSSETNAESLFKRLGRSLRPKSSSTWRTGAVIDWGDPTRGHGSQAHVAIGCKSNSEVVEGIQRTVLGQAEGKDGASEKVDFVWSRFRELELARGWWEDARTTDYETIRQSALKRLGYSPEGGVGVEVTGASLGDAVSRTVDDIVKVFDSLPRCTAFIVYSGTGDPREIHRLTAMRQQYQREYQTKNWDNLSVKWTDTEVQALSRACQQAREGVGFVVVK